jgi:SNF2 family DNA or RNA helicase
MTAEVRLSPDHEGVEIFSTKLDEDVANVLHSIAPDLRARTSRGGGLRISFADAAELLSVASLGWASDAERAVVNRAAVRDRAPRVAIEAEAIGIADAEVLRGRLKGSGLAEILDLHQMRNVALMTVEGGWGACIFDEQGTGKTPTLIAAFDLLVERNEADTLVVVSPKSMVGEWAEEFRRFCGELYRVVALEGSRRQRATALAAGADVVILNYEAAITLAEDLRLLASRSRAVLAVDESFNVKNPDAARTAAISELREWCSRCFVLCGTPAPNAPRDLVSQVDLVDFGMTFDGLSLMDDPEQDREPIRVALESRGLFTRNLKHQVLPDLPNRLFAEVAVEFSPEQGRLYSRALDGLISDLEQADDVSFLRDQLSFAERRSTLLRLCSNPMGVFPKYAELPGKVVALDRLLERQAESNEKVVLWSFYRASLDYLAERYVDYGVARIDGSIQNVGARREAVRSFQEDEETLIFLGNPAAAGAGLTLHRAALAIYESFSNQAAHFMQSLDRIHRRGQERDVEYLILLCEGSLEKVEYERILRKVELQADVLGDPKPYRPTRQALLEELVGARDRLSDQSSN